MEDAQVKSGNGLVERSTAEEEMQGMSVAEYAKMRQANQPGTRSTMPRRLSRSGRSPYGHAGRAN
jgi:hypothetical protein